MIVSMRRVFGVVALLVCGAEAGPALAQQTCPYPVWSSTAVYLAGNRVTQANNSYQAKWWTQGDNPSASGAAGPWQTAPACSGGSGSGPTANAGSNFSIAAGSTVTLAGSGSETGATIASYAWKQTAGPGVSLGAANSATATFVAPQVTANTALTFQLTVADAQGATGSASVVVTITPAVAAGPNAVCRPDGLYETPGLDVPYCSFYDNTGREKLANGVSRRVIGYFTSWRTGLDGLPGYLVKDIPWDQITHINYAFAHVDANNQISVGNTASTSNPATGLTWPGVAGAEMDPAYPYQGHFNLLSHYKKLHPGVRTLISVGGWAETGGFLDDNGQRVASGGFYTMTTGADGSVNTAGISTFADSVVAFLRQYGFDGVDIDYEYPTSMNNAGNPDDFTIANARRGGLNASYNVLLLTLRQRLDAAGVKDGRHYLLSIAAPASGYLLRGMENFQGLQYLDYVNVMSYDLHGAWNEFVGPNAALFDDGKDAELTAAGVYGAQQYGGIGYLNVDWAFHYFRGALPAGRINMGLPYYTRGFRGVTGGSNGLWGDSKGSNCPVGTTICGNGAVGIDNLWHDVDAQGNEVGAGSNPLWHALNLSNGVLGSYLGAYGLDPTNNPIDALVGSYVRNYNTTLQAGWLWNAQKSVFLSIEDDQSIGAKAQWILSHGVGGAMIWELAGDYDRQANGQYFIGSTLTRLLHTTFTGAAPYGNQRSERTTPAQAINVQFSLTGYRLGDQNYPINPTLHVVNNSSAALPGGTEFEFDIPTSTPGNFADYSGFGTHAVQIGQTGPNIGGLQGDFDRASITLPSWMSVAPGASVDVSFVYYLPVSGPINFTVTSNGTTYAITSEHPELPTIN